MLAIESMINAVKLNAVSAYMVVFGYKGELRGLKGSTATLVNGCISSDDCDKLVKSFEEYLGGHNVDNSLVKVWTDESGSDTRIINFEKLMSKELLLGLNIEDKIRMVELYLGRKVRSWCLMANRVIYKPANIGSGGGWHRDSPFSHQVKFIWYLSEVTEDCGPFQYLPGSNSAKSKRKHRLGRYRFETEKISGEMRTVTGDRGSMLICDTSAIHRGAPISIGCARYALTLYTSADKNGIKRTFNLHD